MHCVFVDVSKYVVYYEDIKHKLLCIRHTRDHYNINNRADNRELAKYLHESHNLNDDLNVSMLQNNRKAATRQMYHKVKLIHKLKTLVPHVLNTEIGDYTKEMCNFY